MSILKLSGLIWSFFLSFCGHQEPETYKSDTDRSSRSLSSSRSNKLYLIVILVQTIEEINLYFDVCYKDFEVQVYNW